MGLKPIGDRIIVRRESAENDRQRGAGQQEYTHELLTHTRSIKQEQLNLF